MDIIPAGTFGASRSQYAQRFDPRPPDIAIFTGAFIGEPEFVELIRGLTQAFPERKVVLQIKPGIPNSQRTAVFIAECNKDIDNLELTEDSVYDIFLRARYSISDTSSVVAEAMQLGMISFAFDLPHIQVANIDREYPGLTISSLNDAIDRIRGIESGKWHYPIEDFQNFVDMSGMVFFDRVRRDVGLSPKEPSIHLLGGGNREMSVMDND